MSGLQLDDIFPGRSRRGSSSRVSLSEGNQKEVDITAYFEEQHQHLFDSLKQENEQSVYVSDLIAVQLPSSSFWLLCSLFFCSLIICLVSSSRKWES